MTMSVSRRRFAMGVPTLLAASALPTVAWAQAAPSGNFLPQPSGENSLDIIAAERLAIRSKAVLEPGAWEYIHGAAGSEWTLRANRLALDLLAFNPGRMAGFSEADTTSELLGQQVAAPFFVCPMGGQDFAHEDADLASVRGAGAARIPYMLSGASNKSMEQVAKEAPADLLRIFAIYLNTDREVNWKLARRARAAGYRAIVMTVDSLGPGTSNRYIAMGSPKTAAAGFGNFDPARGGTGNFRDLKRDFDPADIAMLKEASGLPVMVKGLLRTEDAQRAVAAGAAGVVVSNHGGRTLDGSIPSIDALPGIVRAVGQRVPVLFDSGVRRGVDALRALALGATSVGIGRPVMDAMALGGGKGVADLLNWFRNDLATQMLLVGAKTIGDISPELLVRTDYTDATDRDLLTHELP